MAPAPSACITPAVQPGETALFNNLNRADDLKGIMARKWEMREGTIPDEHVEAELEEQKRFKTQDAIVAHVVQKTEST